MATIAKTDINSISEVTLVETTLTGTDTFVYNPSKTSYLIFRNETAGALTPVIDGDGATSRFLAGVGSIDISAGYSFGSIAAGAKKIITLNNIDAYLSGTIAITGGTGIVASIIEV